MPRSNRWTDADGSTSLEFITAGLVLLLPLVYLVLTLSAIQGGALAVEGAARQAARVYAQADSVENARADAAAAVEVALADYGIASASSVVTVTCRPEPSQCLARRGFVTVTVATSVALPLVPGVLDLDAVVAAPLTATATAQVSRFGGPEQ